MTAQATCPGAGADAHLCVGRHAELPNSERCQVKNTSVFKDKSQDPPGSPFTRLPGDQGRALHPQLCSRVPVFSLLFSMSHAHKPQISPCVPGLEAPCHLPAGEAFSSGERQVGECLGRLEQSGTWAGRPGAGVLGSGSSSRLWGSPSLQGQGARGPRGQGGPVSSTGTVRGARLGCCLFRVSPSHAEASPGLAGAFGRGPWGQARRVTTLPPRGRAPASLLLDLPPSSSGT